MSETIHYTLHIFERLIRQMPPLVPEKIQKDMHRAFEQMRHNPSLQEQDLEDTIVVFGKKVWPYRQAFLEFFRVHEGRLAEKAFLKKASAGIKKKYKEFQAGGGNFRDLYYGRLALFFTSEQRNEICVLLVEVYEDVRRHAKQAVLSSQRVQYEKRIEEFKKVLKDIEKQIEGLHMMADNEQEHPELAEEIRQHIRGFEHGIALLGPSIDYTAVCNSGLHFQMRKEQKRMLSNR
ncbi:hypothetical protein H6758_02975 [Candidatus Nomurabacteria bacterium]|nr:hypothetical protein [Candidatus Nomurabacteria bacterium]